MRAEDLSLGNLLNFQTDEGKIFLNNQRVTMIPSAALSTLRQDLIKTLGMNRTKGFLLRYGWNCGSSDAAYIKNMDWESEKELLWAGPKLHTFAGQVQAQPLITKSNFQKKQLHYEGIWKHSYEAEEHVRLFGYSDKPVCHTLVGYASGYLSTILGKTVIVTEGMCQGMGADHCRWIAKTLEEWQGQVDDELKFYEEESLISELEHAYERLKIERDNLDKSMSIHKRLMQEITRGRNLQSLADVLYESMTIPVLIEDRQLNIMAASGLSTEESLVYNEQFKLKIAEQQTIKAQRSQNLLDFKHVLHTTIEVSTEHWRLIVPIFVRHSIVGYCSFVKKAGDFQDIDTMIIERASAACSLYLLNEQMVIEAEQRIRGQFLDEIINKNLQKKEICKRAHYMGIDMEEDYYIVVINHIASYQTVKEELEFNNKMISMLTDYLKRINFNALVAQKSNDIVFLVHQNQLKQQQLTIAQFCSRLFEYCQSLYPKYFFQIGISSGTDHIEEADIQYQEAQASLKMCTKHNQITSFDSLGIVGILFQSGNKEAIRNFSYNILKEIIEYDQQKNSDLIKTLFFYIKNGGNLEQTAHELALSISGLRYRLEKIKSLLQQDIRDTTFSYQLFLAIQALIVLGEVKLD